MKLLHTADVHLDSPLRSLALRDEGLRERVRAATRTAFARIIDAALEHQVAALLIAGDLYDGAQRSAKTAAFVIGQMERLRAAGIAVYIIKGNHDAENPISGEVALPGNVHVFDGRGGKMRLGESDVWIHGVSFANRHAPDSLLGKFGAPVPGAVNIAMLHTSLAGAAGHDPYAPCTLAELQAMGFDYWALGHVHKRAVHAQSPWVVMPGTPQGRDIGEAGAKSATLLSIADGTIGIEEIATSAVCFQPRDIDLTGCDDDDAIRARIRQDLRRVQADLPPDAEAILRVTLTGQTPRHWQILRDRTIWQEGIARIAHDTGPLWIEALSLSLEPPREASASGAVDELAQLMAQIATEPGFLHQAQAEIDAVLALLPAGRRAELLPDEAALPRLAERLTASGAQALIARMKGAAT